MDSKQEKPGSVAARPAVLYWEDPVYHYLSRLHRSEVASGDDSEAVRFDGLRQELVNQSMSDERYWQFDAEAKADGKERKHERKKRRRPSRIHPSAAEGSINVADLKKRIFNPQVSRENVIKALEALPPAEKKATIAGLPPGLRRKLGDYLQGRRH